MPIHSYTGPRNNTITFGGKRWEGALGNSNGAGFIAVDKGSDGTYEAAIGARSHSGPRGTGVALAGYGPNRAGALVASGKLNQIWGGYVNR